MRAAALAGLSVALSVGCVDDGFLRPPGEPAVEVGTGEAEFVEVAEGEEIALAEGAQGGYHLWVAVRATGLIPRRASLETVTFPEDTERPRQFSVRTLDLARVDEPFVYGVAGLLAVLSEPECHVGRRVVLRATIVDVEGISATDEHVVVPTHPELTDECEP
jgi:hypothetical protein